MSKENPNKLERVTFDATLNPGSGKNPDVVTVQISYALESGRGAGVGIPIQFPTGTIKQDVQGTETEAYRVSSSILNALARRLKTRSLQ